jgi:NAD(P)-dependent dehydrogenase (short-subunit alcohol dehydrogenase family)
MELKTQRFSGKVVIVTGGGKGIGRAESLLFARKGALAIVSDIGVNQGIRRSRPVADEIEAAGGSALALTHDVGTFHGA